MMTMPCSTPHLSRFDQLTVPSQSEGPFTPYED